MHQVQPQLLHSFLISTGILHYDVDRIYLALPKHVILYFDSPVYVCDRERETASWGRGLQKANWTKSGNDDCPPQSHMDCPGMEPEPLQWEAIV
jgi:hypothetical protein